MRIVAEPLTAEAFKPFGAVLEGTPAPGRAYLSDTLARVLSTATVVLALRAQRAGGRRSTALFAATCVLAALAAMVRPELAGSPG